MSKTSLKKRFYGTITALMVITFVPFWYVTDYYLDVGTTQTFKT